MALKRYLLKTSLKRKHFLVPFSQFHLAPVKNQTSDAMRWHQKAIKATKIGALVNITLAGAKGVAGFAVGSTALIADCANSVGDIFCDAVVYYSVTQARKQTPDKPWGRGKLEPLGALVVGGLLCATGGGIGYESLTGVLEIMSNSTNEMLDHTPVVYSGLAQSAALGVSAISVIAKEVLFRYTIAIGSKANSDVVIANAWQHRADACVSSAVFVGLAGSFLGFPILDPVAGVLVSGVILNQAASIAMKAFNDLNDSPAGEEETNALRATCLGVKGIESVVEIKARLSGPFLFVECTVGVNGELSASSAHRLAELVRLALLEKHKDRVANVVVHVDPLGASGLGEQAKQSARSHHEIYEEIRRILLTNPDGVTSGDGGGDGRERDDEDEEDKLRHISEVTEVLVFYRDDGRVGLKVDVCMNPDLSIREAHRIAVLARRRIESCMAGVADVDVDLELYEGDDKTTDRYSHKKKKKEAVHAHTHTNKS